QPVISTAKAPQQDSVVPVVATAKMAPTPPATASAERPSLTDRFPVQRTVLSTMTRVPAASSALTSGSSAPGVRLPELDDSFKSRGHRVPVAAREQLNQSAGWLDGPVQRLLPLNRPPARQSPPLGAAVRLDFSKVSAVQFTQRRLQYHRSLEEE